MGATQICLTAHHGAGFTLWRSNLTAYGVQSSSYPTDLLAEFAASCRAHNLSICYYWDMGNGYGARQGLNGTQLLDVQLGWLREVVGAPGNKYGPIDRMWLDDFGGAGYLEVSALVRSLSPDTVMSPGLDGGHNGGSDSYGQYPLYHNTNRSVTGQPQGWSAHGHNFTLRETDMTIQGKLVQGTAHDVSWFWENRAPFLTASELWGFYLATVMRGGSLIINMPPSVYCEVPPKYRSQGQLLGEAIRRTFSDEALVGKTTAASAPCQSLSLEIDLSRDGNETFDGVLLSEDLAHGQRVTSYNLSVRIGDQWVRVPAVHGQTVSHQLLDVLPASLQPPAVRVTAVRFQCMTSVANPVFMASMSLVKLKPPP